jgi:hypothetical protein
MPGFDYDVTNEEVLLTRLGVKDGWLTLPDGMRYRMLVLPNLPNISLSAIQKVRDLVRDGATVLGQRPERATGLDGGPGVDAKIQSIGSEVWGNCDGTMVKQRRFGKGRVVCDGTSRERLMADGVKPDFESASASGIDFIHRNAGGVEIYFVSNQSAEPRSFPATFRVKSMTPELWDAVSGSMRTLAHYESTTDGRTRLPLELQPYGSVFVVFRKPAGDRPKSLPQGSATWIENGRFVSETLEQPSPISGPWHVRFASPAATPSERDFASLTSWTASPEDTVRHFSGHATYSKSIDVPAAMLANGKRLILNLGQVGEIAEVWVNGTALGTYWMPPFAVDITSAARAGKNQLEIRITNMWINRVRGDSELPSEKRTTRTNIATLPPGPLMPSGLMGPVTLQNIKRTPH